MLTSLRLKDFKSFADQSVELSPLTVLFGANASGKSNFLDAIRFLQGIGLDLSVADIFRGRMEGGREVWPGLRGGMREAVRSGAKSFTIESRWMIGKEELVHSITCRLDPDPVVEHESLEARGLGGYLFDTPVSSMRGWDGLSPSSMLKSTSKKGRGLRASAAERHPAQRSLLGQIEHHRGRSEDVRLNDVVTLCHALQTAMRGTISLAIDPARMRSYVPLHVDHLGTGGENISAVLRRLSQDPERKSELMGWLSKLCAPELADIDFIETELGEVLLRLVEKDGTRVSARSLPDGVLRGLGVMIAVLTAPEGSLILIEEVDRGLHPSRAGLLARVLESATRPATCQLVATTYSPSLLQALSKEDLGRAIAFGRRAGTAGTLARRLGELQNFDELATEGISQLFTAELLAR